MLLSHIQTVRLILVQIIYLKHCKYLGGDGGQCFDFFFFFLYVVRNMQAEFLVEILRLSCCLEVGL